MKEIFTKAERGVYTADIDITVEEWKKLLVDESVFNSLSLEMVRYWYEQIGYEASGQEIINLYDLDRYSFNSIAKELGKRISKRLNRFKTIGVDGKPTYWILMFEGYVGQKNRGFVWVLRKELVIAIDELKLFPESLYVDPVEAVDYSKNITELEGKKQSYMTTRYERSILNRNEAIRVHGTKCMICDFDFEKVYGECGKGFIEVHHIDPLSEINQEIKIDPKTDLICVCSNCHRMFHRRKNNILSPEELRAIVNDR